MRCMHAQFSYTQVTYLRSVYIILQLRTKLILGMHKINSNICSYFLCTHCHDSNFSVSNSYYQANLPYSLSQCLVQYPIASARVSYLQKCVMNSSYRNQDLVWLGIPVLPYACKILLLIKWRCILTTGWINHVWEMVYHNLS